MYIYGNSNQSLCSLSHFMRTNAYSPCKYIGLYIFHPPQTLRTSESDL